MPTPAEILDKALQRVFTDLTRPIVTGTFSDSVEFVCRNLQNRAGVRLLLACLLAKIHRPSLDIRKPYTEIGDDDAYSGRTYDETYILPFVNEHHLPCNPTTAFLTPALRNRNIVLTPDVDLVGRPAELYQTVLQLLTDAHEERVSAQDLLAETIRWLLVVREERRQRMSTLLANLQSSKETLPLSSEDIVALLQQHLSSPRSSRLPVLVVAAAYRAASGHLRERVLPLESHTSADEQTGALGDVQVTLIGDDKVVTSYEMKTRRVTHEDIGRALQKIHGSSQRIDNYIFITTDVIDDKVQDYARGVYEQTGGIEMVVLDCVGFVRYFLHLFHRLRVQYLEAYQDLVLAEPDSSVSQPLKEAFLALRQAAESRE